MNADLQTMLREAGRLVGGFTAELAGAVAILVIGWWFASWAGRWLRRSLARVPRMDPMLVPLAASAVRYGILIVTVLAVLAQFGVETTSLIAVLGAAGLAIGLALQGTLANVASGVMLLLLRPFKAGDYIEAGAIAGTVDEIGLFSTELRTADNRYLAVPNKTLFEAPIVNASRLPTRRIDVLAVLAHDADADRALALMAEQAAADARVQREPKPVVGIRAMTPAGVELVVQVWTRAADALALQFTLNAAVRRALTAAGLPFARPR